MSALVLPTLTAFTSGRLRAILTAKSQADFTTAFDALFARNVNVVYNGKHLTREQYQAQLLSQSSAAFGEQGASVSVQGQLEVPGDQGQISGLVGLFYTSLVDSRFLVMGAPAESKVVSSFNVIIQATEPRPQTNPLIRGYFDPRRVVTVNQIATDQALHVTIPAASINSSSPGVTENVALGPGPRKLPPGPFGSHFGPRPVHLDPIETNAHPETFPGDGEFGAPPVLIPGETIGEDTNTKA
ncbi:hypothetical protein DEU56DRAFT_873102 [Suillus clintonianus]|uniref:uncharacterized protein n=1 Tax=Suillus clintonianus TaxID=1904413 RepID=UPI001B88272B|nr:uncharacterized protein DEU56DRAFT_873102 [Suillus clintonianus]KAG2125382.1 hypothetical protein DEU56DRAFT_873102 [Suillus clintonianus]